MLFIVVFVFAIIDVMQKLKAEDEKEKKELAGKSKKSEQGAQEKLSESERIKRSKIRKLQMKKVKRRDLSYLLVCLYFFIEMNQYGSY